MFCLPGNFIWDFPDSLLLGGQEKVRSDDHSHSRGELSGSCESPAHRWPFAEKGLQNPSVKFAGATGLYEPIQSSSDSRMAIHTFHCIIDSAFWWSAFGM